jgi:uncharacterized protein YoxC
LAKNYNHSYAKDEPDEVSEGDEMNTNKTSIFTWITGSGNPITATSRIAVMSAVAVILSAGILGYTALYDLFISIGLFATWLAVFFPLLFDLAEVSAAVSLLNAKLQGEDDPFSWRLVIAFTLAGIGANIAHAVYAYLAGEIGIGQATLAVFFTSLFPLSVALVTHLLKKVITRDITRRAALSTLAELETQRGTLVADLDKIRQELEEVAGHIAALSGQRDALTVEIDDLKRQRKAVRIEQISPKVDDLNAARLAKKVQAMDVLLSYLSNHPYASLAEAGQAIGRSKTTVGNYVDELTTAGRLQRNGNGWEVSR